MKKLLLMFFIICFLGIPLAEGHPFTTETKPPGGSNAPVGITQVTARYSEAVEIDFSWIKVYDSNGNQIDNKDTSYF